MREPSLFDAAQFRLSLSAVMRQRAPGEYRVLKERAPAATGRPPEAEVPRRRHPRPVYRSVKAWMRGEVRKHNLRRWAVLRPRGKRYRPKP
jgi:hypothetical protein